jgi:hypothetical protein
MPSSLSAPPSQGIDAEDSNQKRSSFAASEHNRRGSDPRWMKVQWQVNLSMVDAPRTGHPAIRD